jgi:hypothetical protein
VHLAAVLTKSVGIRTDQDWCPPASVGYQPAVVMEAIDSTSYSSSAVNSADTLTSALVLHPIAAGIAFISFLISAGAGVIGSVIGAMVAFVAWAVTLVVMAIDFALFEVSLRPSLGHAMRLLELTPVHQIIKDNVNSDGSGSYAYWSVGMWTTMAAMILLFLGMFIVLFTCCSARLARRREYKTEAAATGRRRFF